MLVQKPITLFIATVEELLGERVSRVGFAEVKTLLLEATETPIITVKA